MGTGDNRSGVSVRIAGHDYKIRGDGDDEGIVRIAGYVDRAMERVRERTGTVDSLDVAVLTCLNLAREILALLEQRTGPIDDARVRSLIDRVEAVLSSESANARLPSSEPSANPMAAAQPRTLDLSSVEDLRERRPSGGSPEPGLPHAEAPRARAAAGGRDRVG